MAVLLIDLISVAISLLYTPSNKINFDLNPSITDWDISQNMNIYDP